MFLSEQLSLVTRYGGLQEVKTQKEDREKGTWGAQVVL